MKNWNDKATKKSASRTILSIITALVLVLQVFGIPGVKVADKELTSYEKAMAALPGWVNANGDELTATNGNVSNNLGRSTYNSLTFDSTGNPCIAWDDNTSGNSKIYFARWNGSSWVNVSGAILSATNGNMSNISNSTNPSLAIDSSGNPCITWTEDILGNLEIYFSRWNGSNWVNASGATLTALNGNVSNNSGYSFCSSLVLESTGNPCIVWHDNTPGIHEIFYAKWDGSTWVNVSGATLTATNGNVSKNTGFSYAPSLALDSSSNPCIAWYDWTPGNSEIYFARWNGSSWVNVSGVGLNATNGNVSNNSGYSSVPSLQLDSAGNPCIAWDDNTPGNYEIYFARWNGSSWVNASGEGLNVTNGNVSNNSGYSDYSSLQLDSAGNPCIAWENDTTDNKEIYFTRWSVGTPQPTSNQWVNAANVQITTSNGVVFNTPGNSIAPNLVIDPKSSNPCITWSDDSTGNYEIYFAKWNGSIWVNVSGSPFSTNNGNVSNTPGDSYNGSLVIDSFGYPCISWSDDTRIYGYSDIYFTRWNGSSWVNAMGIKFTSINGNISNNPGSSWDPQLIIDSFDNPCIAWTDKLLGKDVIFFARWNGSSWVNISGVTLTATNGSIISNNSYSCDTPKIQLDKAGNPNIAWRGTMLPEYKPNVYFAKWDGSTWVNVSGIPLTNTYTNAFVSVNGCNGTLDLVLDTLNNPCIAWDNNFEIFYTRWSGTSWINVYGSNLSSSNGIVVKSLNWQTCPSLVNSSSGYPWISWGESKPGTTISDKFIIAKWNGNIWTNVSNETLSNTNGNVSNDTGISSGGSLSIDLINNKPCIVQINKLFGQSDIFFAKWNGTPQQPQPTSGIKEFIKEVDTNGDGIFDDNLKPVSEGQILRYKLTVVFDKKGVSGEISDIIPENTEYVGMEDGYKKPFSTYSDGKEWEMVTSSNEPDNKYARRNGAYLRWSVNSDDGLRQEFVYKVKSISGSNVLNKPMTGTSMKYDNKYLGVLSSFNVNSFPAIFNNQENQCSSSNIITNPSDNCKNLIIKEPIEDQFLTMGCGMNVRWDVPSDVKLFDKLNIYVFAYDKNGNDVLLSYNWEYVSERLLNIVIDRAQWWDNDLFKDCNPGDSLKGYMIVDYFSGDSNGNYSVKNTTSVKINLTKWPVLNYAKWADPFADLDNGERWPIIFINGINPFGRGNETLLWDDILNFLKKSPMDLENKLRSFKPYIFSYDSHEPYINTDFQKIAFVGKELNREIKRNKLYNDKGLYIVAHSMGGLVARSFMAEKFDVVPDKFCGDYVTRLITLATPHHGAYDYSRLASTSTGYVNDMIKDDFENSYLNCQNPFLWTLNKPIDEKLLFRDKLVVLGTNKDEVVPINSALFAKDILKPRTSLANRCVDKFEDIKGSILQTIITGLNFSNSAHISLCRSAEAMQEIKKSLHAPIILVNCYTEPGKAIIEVNGKAFGDWQGKTKLPISIMFENIPVKGEILWSDKQVVTTLTPAKKLNNTKKFDMLFNNVTINQAISNVIVNMVIEGNGKPSSISEDTPLANSTTIDEESYLNKSGVALSVWPSKSQLVKGESVEFTIKARNTGTSELTNVDIISNIPRELEFVSSTLKGVMGKNKLRIQLSKLMPKETTMFKVVCKLDESVYIPEDSGLWMLYSANLSTGTNINTSASAIVKYFTRKPTENLSMNIIWKGVNTKTNEAKAGNPITLTIDVNGGSMPYHLTIDWGDGSDKEKKTWNKMLDPKPVFNKTYDNPGDVQVSITCVDAYGKTTSVTRTLHIR